MNSSNEPRTIVAGRYELRDRLAMGGMAAVYLGQDQILDRAVAIKVLHSNLAADPDFVTRFRREAQAAARLSHPNIVAVYDWGPHVDSYYIAMEYIRGETLADLLAAHGSMEVDRALGIACDIVDALAAAHAEGTVHRDVKPSNIIVTPSGRAKVTDFGIARAYDRHADLTLAGTMIGTASYLSPEQAQGHPVDPRSDLYSLGVVIFEMLTGRRPFSGPSPLAIAKQHIEDAPPRVSTYRPSVAPAIDDLVDRLLAKEPGDRFARATALRQELDLRRAEESQLAERAEVAAERQADPAPADEQAATAVMGVSAPRADTAGRSTEEPTRTAVMPPSARPDARVPAPVPVRSEPDAGRGSGSGFVAALAVLLVGAFVGLILFLGPRIGVGADSDQADDVDATTPTEPAAPETSDTTDVERRAVPDVIGESQSDAQGALEELGFVVQVEPVDASSDDDVGRVVSQAPEQGQELAVGETVTIRVGRAPDTTTTTAPSTTTSAPATTTSSTQPPSTTGASTSTTAGG